MGLAGRWWSATRQSSVGQLVYVKPADSAVEHMLVEVGMASAHLSKTIGPMHCSHTANELHVCFVMA